LSPVLPSQGVDAPVLPDVTRDELFENLVPVDAPDQAAGIGVTGDVGGIAGEEVSNQLAYGVVTLLFQGGVDAQDHVAHRGVVPVETEADRFVVRSLDHATTPKRRVAPAYGTSTRRRPTPGSPGSHGAPGRSRPWL